MAFLNFDVDRWQNVMNGAGNVVPPSVDGNIHPESSARNLGTYYRSYNPELISGLPIPNKSVSSSARAVASRGNVSSGSSGGSGSLGAAAPSAKSLDYLNADLAKYYGMSKETAYSEALSNTAYQRAVMDMQAAGLNPAVLFGAGRASAADGVNYIKADSGGSGSGSGRRRYSGGKSSGKLFSGSAYSVMSALGGIVGAAATKSAGGYWLGTSLAQGAMSALSLLTGHKG